MLRTLGPLLEEAAIELAARIEREVHGSLDLFDDLDRLPPRLSTEDMDRTVLGLIAVVESVDPPPTAAVWALGKSADRRIVAPLKMVVERHADDVDVGVTSLVYNAIVGLDNVGGLTAVDRDTWHRLRGRQDDLGRLARNLQETRSL